MTEKLEFCTLPTEIQNLIALNLHPSAAIALRQTNRWFHTHISLHRLDSTEVQKYLHWLELKSRHIPNYACFSCLCLKPQSAFTVAQLCAEDGRFGDRFHKRFCVDCGVRDSKFGAFSVVRVAGQPRLRVFCGACLSIQNYFCGRCHCCNGCIAKARTWTGSAALRNRSGGERICQSHCTR